MLLQRPRVRFLGPAWPLTIFCNSISGGSNTLLLASKATARKWMQICVQAAHPHTLETTEAAASLSHTRAAPPQPAPRARKSELCADRGLSRLGGASRGCSLGAIPESSVELLWLSHLPERPCARWWAPGLPLSVPRGRAAVAASGRSAEPAGGGGEEARALALAQGRSAQVLL